jgi:hypothetical protein
MGSAPKNATKSFKVSKSGGANAKEHQPRHPIPNEPPSATPGNKK